MPPFNGSGTYALPTPQYPAVAGTTIVAADRNTIDADIATALSNCITRDGQSPPTANLPMGAFKFTGAGKAAARDQFATYEQVQDGEANFVTAANVGGTADAITLSVSPAPAAYEAAIDLFYIVEAVNTSEDVTHNLNSLGAKNTKKFNGVAKTKVSIGDLQIGMLAHLKYDGTDLVLMNPRGYNQGADVASAATIDLDAVTGDLVDVTGITTITAITLRRGQERTIRFTGILTLTHGASLVLPGSVSIVTAAGDFAIVRGYAAGVVRCVAYTRADGTDLLRYVSRQVTTSGTDITFSNIPATARRITVNFEGVSTNAAVVLDMQLGTSGGIQLSGYTGVQADVPDAAANDVNGALTSAWGLSATMGTGDSLWGACTLTLSDVTNGVWCFTGNFRKGNSGTAVILAGMKSLSGVLDRIKINANGTFDAGAISILVE